MNNCVRLLPGLALVALLAACGGGAGGDSDGLTPVRIVVGGDAPGDAASIQAVPPELIEGSLWISIYAPDMETMEKEVHVRSEDDVIEVEFLVPNGPERHVLVEAYDASGTLRYSGLSYLELTGAPVTVTVQMLPVEEDFTPPSFPGLAAAEAQSSTSALLSWSPAADDQTQPSGIVYYIYESLSPGLQDFQTPSYTTTAGATSYTVLNLTPGETYYYVVRARDAAGNVDANVVELEVQTPAAGDTTPPDFAGLSFAEPFPPGEAMLFWSPASDDVSPPSAIEYLIYESQSPGLQDFQNPTFVTAPGAVEHIVTGLQPGFTYYYVVRARDQAGNVDSNTVEFPVQMP
ncbi:MAG: fibronectin type III domain-containing protein [bacterium]